jgi:hypothetical protein
MAGGAELEQLAHELERGVGDEHAEQVGRDLMHESRTFQ